MPFKSEKQRRYLWANEPEIARDWTDTYGSRIEAALGGIMRLGLYNGGPPGGGDKGMKGTGDSYGGSYGPGRNPSPHEGLGAKDPFQGAPPGLRSDPTHTPTGPKSFGDKIGGFFKNFNPLDYAPFVGKKSLTGMGIRAIGDVFGKFGTGWDSSMGPREDMGYNPNKNNPFSGPDRGDRPYIPPYLNDVYAQNIMEEDDLDIDTSTGNMEDWSQRFRVDDQYRQDQGALDDQIREYISKLYT